MLGPSVSGVDPLAWRAKNWGRRLEWHFDARVPSSITVATGVSQWADLSGNARHLSNSTPGAQPGNGGVINGRNAITFSPASTVDVLDSSGLAALSTDTLATFMVARMGSGTGNYGRFGGLILNTGSDETDAAAFSLQRDATSETWRVQRNSTSTSAVGFTYDKPFLLMVVWNGSTMVLRSRNLAAASASSTGTFVGNRLWAGFNLDGAIGEWLAVRGPFAEGELARQYRAMAYGWQVT